MRNIEAREDLRERKDDTLPPQNKRFTGSTLLPRMSGDGGWCFTNRGLESMF